MRILANANEMRIMVAYFAAAFAFAFLPFGLIGPPDWWSYGPAWWPFSFLVCLATGLLSFEAGFQAGKREDGSESTPT